MKLVTSNKKYLKYVMKPNFKDGHPFSKHLFAVEMGKTEITMNKPVYLRLVILDLSKTLMHDFHTRRVLMFFKERAAASEIFQ